MASSKSKAKTESDVRPAGEKTWHFDDDTSKGEGQEVLNQKSLLYRKTVL